MSKHEQRRWQWHAKQNQIHPGAEAVSRSLTTGTRLQMKRPATLRPNGSGERPTGRRER